MLYWLYKKENSALKLNESPVERDLPTDEDPAFEVRHLYA
jgi:hypothetical protein